MIVMKIDNIKGDCNIKEFKEYINLESCSWDIEREFKDSGKAGGSDINMGIGELVPLECAKVMDKSSVFLMHEAIAGGSLGVVEICYLATQGLKDKPPEVYLHLKLDTAVITGWNMSASGDDRPEETFKIWYKKIWMQYRSTVDGVNYKVEGDKGWDRVVAKPWKA